MSITKRVQRTYTEMNCRIGIDIAQFDIRIILNFITVRSR